MTLIKDLVSLQPRHFRERVDSWQQFQKLVNNIFIPNGKLGRISVRYLYLSWIHFSYKYGESIVQGSSGLLFLEASYRNKVGRVNEHPC